MNAFRRFWNQPSTHYRNFQIAFALLALNFAIPTLSYLFAPEYAIGQFASLNETLGGAVYDFPESQSRFWRYLGTANVAALAFMCLWLMGDLRRRWSTIVPLTFLKGTAATIWLVGFLSATAYPAMLAASLFDYATCLAFVVFGTLAYADIQGHPDAVLVPEPAGGTEMGWTRFEQSWAEAILEATLPPNPEAGLPGLETIELKSFWDEYVQQVPLHFRLGLRAATWAVTFWPILTFRSFRTFHGLSKGAKDEVLQSIEHSRFFVIRQLTFVLKTTAGFAYFRDRDVQDLFPTAYPDR